jgi:hypothetical protein
MTSIAPDMLQYDPDQMESRGLWTPQQAAQAREARAQIAALSAPAAPDLANGAAPGYGTGKAIRGVIDKAGALASAPFNPGAVAAAFPEAVEGGMNAVEGVGRFARNLGVSTLGLPNSWLSVQSQPVSDAQARTMAPPGIAAPGPATAQAQLQQPNVAYRGRGQTGGGGLGGIANEMKRVDQMSRDNAAEQEKRLGRDFENIQKADEGVAEAEANAAADRAAVYDVGLQQQREQDALDAQAHEQERAEVDSAKTRYDSAKDDYSKLTVDPQRRWKEKSTAGKVGAGIAIALGALGASLTGGPNYALDIINKAQDDDIDAQLANIDKKGKEVDMQGQALRDLRDSLGSNDRMRNVMRAQKWEDVLNEMKSRDLSNAPAEIQAHAQASIAEAEARYNDAVGKVHADLVDDVRQNLAARANVAAQADNSAQGWASINVQRAAAMAKAQGKTLPDSVKAELAKIDAAQASLTSINKDKPGAVSAFFSKIAPWDTDADKFERESSNKITGVAKALSGEATNESDIKRNEANRPRATDSDKTAMQKTKVFNDQLNDRKRALLAQYGIEMPTTSLEGL